MKNTFAAFQKLAGLVLFSFAFIHTQAQDLDRAAVQRMIDSRHFFFRAQTAIPLGGAARQLSSDYDVSVNGDSMTAYLPYFGRAYSAPPQGEGPIDFTSKDFTYNVKTRDKGWDITIEPKDGKDIRSLQFSLSESGYGTLQVTSNSRQAISFNGYLLAK